MANLSLQLSRLLSGITLRQDCNTLGCLGSIILRLSVPWQPEEEEVFQWACAYQLEQRDLSGDLVFAWGGVLSGPGALLKHLRESWNGFMQQHVFTGDHWPPRQTTYKSASNKGISVMQDNAGLTHSGLVQRSEQHVVCIITVQCQTGSQPQFMEGLWLC